MKELEWGEGLKRCKDNDLNQGGGFHVSTVLQYNPELDKQTLQVPAINYLIINFSLILTTVSEQRGGEIWGEGVD